MFLKKDRKEKFILARYHRCRAAIPTPIQQNSFTFEFQAPQKDSLIETAYQNWSWFNARMLDCNDFTIMIILHQMSL